jgi:hypothetical protein
VETLQQLLVHNLVRADSIIVAKLAHHQIIILEDVVVVDLVL